MRSREFIGFTLGPIIIGVLGLISVPLSTWFFEPEQLGRFAFIQAMLGLLIAFLFMGLDQAFVRDFYSSNNQAQLLFNAIFPSIALFCGLIPFYFIFQNQISDYLFGEGGWIPGMILLVCCLLSIIARYSGLIIRMRSDSKNYTLGLLMPSIVMLLGIIMVAITTQSGDYLTLMYLSLVGISFSCVVWTKVSFDVWKIAPSAFDAEKIIQSLKYGLPLMVDGFLYLLMNTIDKLLIRQLVGLEELGIYNSGYRFAAIMMLIQRSFSTAWVPIAYKWFEEKREISAFEAVSHKLAFLLFLVFLLLIICKEFLYSILATEYHDAIRLMPLLSIVPICYTLSEVMTIGIKFSRKTYYAIWSTILCLLISVFLGFWLMPAYGAKGAAFTMAVVFVMYLVIKTEISKSLWEEMRVGKIYLLLGIMLLLGMVSLLGKYDVIMAFICIFVILVTQRESVKFVVVEIKRAFSGN